MNIPLLQELFAKDPERGGAAAGAHPYGPFRRRDEIAAAAAILASDDSSFITASTFLVDAGISGSRVTLP